MGVGQARLACLYKELIQIGHLNIFVALQDGG